MPTIPYPTSRVAQDALPGVRVSTGAPPGAFGVPAPLDLSGPTALAAQMADEHRQAAEETQVIAADNQLHDLKASIERDTVQNFRGINALGAASSARAAWEKGVATIQQNVPGGDHIQAIVARRAATHWGDLVSTVESHADSEYRSAQTREFATAVDNRTANAVRDFADPTKRQFALDEGKSIITLYGKQAGWTPDETRHRLETFASATHASVIEKMVNEHQDILALTYLNAHRTELSGKDLSEAERLTGEASVLGEAQRQADRITKGSTGLLTPGNIDLTQRPRVKNPDGSISTVRSMSFEEGGKEILIPTITPDGKTLTNEQAIARYHATGQHLGIFANSQVATDYANRLHEAQAAQLRGEGDGTVPLAGPSANLTGALAEAAKITDPRVRESTEHRVRQHFADLAAADREAKSQAFTAASGIIEGNGGRFDAIPLKMRQAMSPEENGALQRRADQIRNPERVTDPQLWMSILNAAGLSDATRSAFAQMDLGKYRNHLSESDFNNALRLQLSVRTQQLTGEASEAKAQARKQETAQAKLDREAAQREEARKLLEGAGIHLPPSVPGGPIQRVPPLAPGAPPANANQAGGGNVAPVTVRPVPGRTVPQPWIDHATRNEAYRKYLQHMGVIQVDEHTPAVPTVPGRRDPGGNVDLRTP